MHSVGTHTEDIYSLKIKLVNSAKENDIIKKQNNLLKEKIREMQQKLAKYGDDDFHDSRSNDSRRNRGGLTKTEYFKDDFDSKGNNKSMSHMDMILSDEYETFPIAF